MKRPAKCITLITLVLFAACAGRDLVSDIPIINFEGAEEKVFDISEILESPKLVQLETNEKALIGYARFAVGEKYIIAVSSDDIFQFTSEGAFIRILAQRGGGPQEVQDVGAFSMDDNEQRLYIDHIGRRTSIMVFDLNSGNFDGIIQKPLEALGLENGFSIDQMMVVNDRMYCIPERNYAGQTGLYIQRTSGQFLAGFPRDDQRITASAYVTASPFLAIGSERNSIRYMSRDTDTLFSITENSKDPYVAIRYEDKFIYEPNLTEMSGNLMSMLGEGPSSILFQSFTGTVKLSGHGGTASTGWGSFYFIDKTDFKPEKISRLTMDELEFPVKLSWRSSNDKVFLTIPAVDFKDLLRAAIENSSGNPEALERWQSLDAQISEYDNPILLIGKMK